jgi:chromosome segregation ATPase
MSENSGSRPFSPIYNNFQDLLDNNQGIFRLFRKTKNPGMYQAVWLARQAEMETLKERLTQTEELLEQQKQFSLSGDLTWQDNERVWFEQHNELLQEIEELKAVISSKENSINGQKETIQGLEKEIEAWKEKSIDLREDREKFKVLSRSLERVVNMKTQQDDKSQKDLGKIKTHLNLSQHALIKLDDEYTQVELENKQLKAELEELRDKLSKNENYTKEYRKINHRMENELYRVTNELEKVQSLLN